MKISQQRQATTIITIMLYLALTTFFAEEVAADHIIADFAELCNKRFSSKSSGDAINDPNYFKRY